MNSNLFLSTVLLALSASLNSVLAEDAPTSKVTPMETKTVTFLGVEVSKLSAALRSQIEIPEGVGLIVDHVAEKSGAEAGGLLKYDILLKVNDQLIINNEQLKTFIQTKKPEETVKVEILRKGEKMTLTIQLGEREETQYQAFGKNFPIPQMPSGFNFNFNMEELNERIAEIQAQAEEIGNKALLHIPEIIIEDSSSEGTKRTTIVGIGKRTLISDKDGQVTRMEIRNGETFFHITGKDGKVLYEGKKPSDEELKALPENVQQTIKELSEKEVFDWKSLRTIDPEDIKVILNTRKEEAKAEKPSKDKGA